MRLKSSILCIGFCISINGAAAAETFDALLKQADSSYGTGQRNQALAQVERALKMKPGSYEACSLRARILIDMDKRKESLIPLSDCIRLKPNDTSAYKLRGAVYKALGKFEEAKSDYARLIRLAPDDSLGYLRSGDICETMKNDRGSLQAYTQGIRRHLALARLYRKRGQTYLRLHDKTHALADFAAALRASPKDSITYMWRAKTFADFGDFNKATADFERAIKYEPTSASNYVNLGATLYFRGDGRRAAEVLKKATELEPNNIGAHNNLGMALEQIGAFEQAQTEFEKCLKLDPGQSINYANSARMNLRSGKFDEAVDDFVGMTSVDSEDAEPGLLPESDANFRMVIKQLDRVIKINPSDATNFYNRAVAYFCVGDFAKASDDFSRYINMQRWNGDAPVYSAILKAVSLRHLGKEPEAKAVLQEATDHLSALDWKRLLLHDVLAAKAVKISRSYNRAKIVTMRCFRGLNLGSLGDTEQCKRYLTWVKANSNVGSDEYVLANSSLLRIGADKPKLANREHVPMKSANIVHAPQKLTDKINNHAVQFYFYDLAD